MSANEFIISSLKSSLIKEFASMNNDQIGLKISAHYDTELIDFIDEHLHDDGVYEYFVLGNNAYYLSGMSTLLDNLDYSKYIAYMEEIDNESEVGI